MNEIDKMKTDLARYHAALKDIAHGVYQVEPSVIADRALNPPPPPPVTLTLENILAALKKRSHNIRFYSDGSGYLYNNSYAYAEFFSLQQALDILEARGV